MNPPITQPPKDLADLQGPEDEGPESIPGSASPSRLPLLPKAQLGVGCWGDRSGGKNPWFCELLVVFNVLKKWPSQKNVIMLCLFCFSRVLKHLQDMGSLVEACISLL